MPDRGVPPKNRCARCPDSMYIKNVLKIRGWGWFSVDRTGTKKDA